jgi:hypothetical protein
MSFAAPALLGALGLLLPVLLAFLVKRRRDVMRVPSTLLWRLAGMPTTQNRRLRNLRRLLSLLACLGGVAALVVAAARPSAGGLGETVAIVVDVSASMDAEGRNSPLERARRFAADRIRAGGPGDRYIVIAAGAAPVRLAGPIAPGPELDAALDALLPERGRADLDAAVDLATALVAHEHGRRVIVLGDGGEIVHDTRGLPNPTAADAGSDLQDGGSAPDAGADSGAARAVAVSDVPVTQRAFRPVSRDNLGIAAFATRPAPDAREDQREAIVTIATSSAKARVARLVITADGHEIAQRRVDVPASGEAEVRLRVLASIARLEAAVAPDDGAPDVLTSDDRAIIAEAARPPPRVLLVQSGSDAGVDTEDTAGFFVERALEAAGIKEIVHAEPSLGGTRPVPGDVLVALGDGPESAVDVPALYIATRTGALPYTRRQELGREATHLRSLDARDPLLRGVSLDGVTIEHATAVTPPAGARALVDLDGGTVLFAGGAGKGAFVYLGVDPAKSDLVLKVAFPVLVANALQTLAGAADVVVADTIARSEITLREAPDELPAPEEPEARSFAARFHRPAALLALLAIALLALEAWGYAKGWSV